jgi:hypothetical protein
MCRIGTLALPCFEPSSLLTQGEQRIKEEMLGAPLYQTLAKFTQNTGIKAGISQF